MIWWFVSARKWFKGPKVNVEHMMLGRNEVLEGKDEERSSSSGGSHDGIAIDGAKGDIKGL